MRRIDTLNEKVETHMNMGYIDFQMVIFPKIFKTEDEAKQFLKRRSPGEWGLCKRKVGEWISDEED